MAGMDSDQIIGSCNAAGMHSLQVRAVYGCEDERNLGGHRYLRRIFEAHRHGGDGQ
jgi:hypothetical protein